MSSLQTRPYMLNGDDDANFGCSGLQVSVKASTAQTGGAFNLFQVIAPAGSTTPLHIHYAEDVALFVLEGSLAVFWGEEEKQAAAGSYSFLPRGTPHGFRVQGAGHARVLYMTLPGGFDGFVSERALWSRGAEGAAAAAAYRIEILGPLPE